MQKSSEGLGNSDVKQMLQSGDQTRDELVEFIASRLSTISTVQRRELGMLNNESQRRWWKKVADAHKENYTKPDPTRWRLCGQLYEDAMLALCAGHLGRGRDLLATASAEENRTMEAMGDTVSKDHIPELTANTPGAADSVVSGQGCGERPPHEAIQTAREIQNVSAVFVNPPNRGRAKDPWWTLEEEEEETEANQEV